MGSLLRRVWAWCWHGGAAAHPTGKRSRLYDKPKSRSGIDHVVEMFNRAVDQLGSEKLEVRLGAIYTLKRISRDPQYVDYRIPILETLTAYVRERTREDTSAEPPVDVREIMSLLSESLSEQNK